MIFFKSTSSWKIFTYYLFFLSSVNIYNICMDKKRVVKTGFLSLFQECLIQILLNADVITTSLCCQAKTVQGYRHHLKFIARKESKRSSFRADQEGKITRRKTLSLSLDTCWMCLNQRQTKRINHQSSIPTSQLFQKFLSNTQALNT